MSTILRPEGWSDTRIGLQATLQRGYDITRAAQRPGKVPVVSSSGVSSYHDTVGAKGPGVILGRKGIVGSVHFVSEDYWPHDTTLWVKDFHGNDPRFVYYFFKAMARQLAKMDVGSANPSLNRNHVHPIRTYWPVLTEQLEISKILALLDDRIAHIERINQTLESIARAIFKSWFVDFDPVRAKAEGREPEGMDAATAALFPCEFEDSRTSDLPSGWGVMPLHGIAEFSNGAAYKEIHFSPNNEGLPVIKIAELKAGVTETTKFTQTKLNDRFQIELDEILFSWSGNPDTSIDTFIWDGGPAWLNQHIFRVRENGTAPRAWVYIQLKTLRSVFAEIARDKQTTGLGHVTIADMKRLMVCKPSETVVSAFDEIARPILEKVALNQLSRRVLASIRDALLPRLISGKLRVPEAEKLVEAAL